MCGIYVTLCEWEGDLISNDVLTKHCVAWIHCHLILGSISNQSFRVRECHVARCGPVSLVIGNDLHFAVLEDPHTRVGGPQVNPYRCSLGHVACGEDKTVNFVVYSCTK